MADVEGRTAAGERDRLLGVEDRLQIAPVQQSWLLERCWFVMLDPGLRVHLLDRGLDAQAVGPLAGECKVAVHAVVDLAVPPHALLIHLLAVLLSRVRDLSQCLGEVVADVGLSPVTNSQAVVGRSGEPDLTTDDLVYAMQSRWVQLAKTVSGPRNWEGCVVREDCW